MKKLIPLTLFWCAFSILHAQVQEGLMLMSQGSQNAFYTDFENARAKDIEDLWTQYAKDLNGKTGKVKKTDEYLTDDATIKDMSANTVDVYALAKQEGDNVRFVLWFNLGGAYLNSRDHPAQIAAGYRILSEFTRVVEIDRLEKVIKEQESLLKQMGKDLSGFEKDQAGLEKDIADYEKKIEEAREGIRQAQARQETQRQAIKDEEKRLQELQDQLKSMKKKN